MSALVSEPVPAAGAVCAVCGHDGASHHSADIACGERHDGGTACWAPLPVERRADGSAGPAALCACRAFVPDELERLRAQAVELRRTVQQMCDALNGYDCPPPNETPLETVTRWTGYLSAAEARVAELEAERHSTNEALSDAAEALRVQRDRIAELERRIEAEECRCPEPAPLCEGCQCQCHAARAEQPVDGITRQIVPVQALREPEPVLCASVRDVLPCVLAEDHDGDVHRDVNGYEWPTAPSLKGRALLDALTVERAEAAHRRLLGVEDPHDSPLHHPYRLGRDLPEGGA